MQRSIHPVQDIRACCAIVRHIRQIQPDIVHCHSSKAGVLGRLAALYTGTPCAYTPHGFAFLRTDLSTPLKKGYWAVERGMAMLGQHTIACGEEEYAIAQSLSPRGTAHSHVHLIKNSISLPASSVPCTPHDTAPHAPLRVGIVGRLAVQRNPQLFSTIATALQQDAHWVWIGAPKDHAGILPAHVECTGWLNHNAAMACMDTLDIYIQTSQWEGLSYSVLEAMGKGKPVVATDIPANCSVIQHGITGFLGSNAQQLTAHVRTLLTDHPLRQRMGAAACDYVARHHSAEATYAAYTPIYKAIAAKQNT